MATSLMRTRKALIRPRLSFKVRGAGLIRSVLLLAGIFLSSRPAPAQTVLGSQVLGESGSQVSSGTLELGFSEGQSVTGSGVFGTTDMQVGFIPTLGVNAVPPSPGNPPFSMVGVSSLTANWLANGNSTATVYNAQISTSANFASVLASSQTLNLSAALVGLNPNTLYYVQTAAFSNLLSTWTAYSLIGSTYTLATPPNAAVGISTFSGWSATGFTLNWSSGNATYGYNPTGTLYLAQISTTANFASIAASSQTANLSASFAGLIQYVNYYARVQAINGNGLTTVFIVMGSTFTGSPFIFPAVINTVAGNGNSGFSGDGGTAVQAAFGTSYGVAVDSTGSVYIADTNNFRVRKVNPNGIITTIAGNGIQGYTGDGGQATSARLTNPSGVAIDATGNVYIADQGNHTVRKVDVTGIITTVAGSNGVGFSGDGGPATSALLYAPTSVAVDAAGNIYIADTNNYRIRKVDTNGIINTVAGSGGGGPTGDGGPATSAALALPQYIAVDAVGNLYLQGNGSGVVRKVDTNGIINAFAGKQGSGYSGDGGPATSAYLSLPSGLAADPAGNVYIGDSQNYRIRKVDTNGIITTVAGNGIAGFSGDGGQATNAQLYYPFGNRPFGVAAATIGSILVGDAYNQRIREVSVATSAPTAPALTALALSPTSVQWSWSNGGRIAAFQLLSSTGGFLSGILSNRTTFFVEINLSTNTSYSRELVAINSAGTSTSTVVSTYTAAAPPLNLALLYPTTATVYVTWDPNTNPSSTTFEVSYTTSSNFTVGSDISTATLTTSSFSWVTGLLGQTTYYFRARAYNGGGYATAFTSIVSTWTAVYQSSVASLSQSTGTPGVAFTISGSGFGSQYAGVTDVRFGVGGSTAPILSWGDTAISVEVPLISTGAYGLLIERQGTVFTSVGAGTFTVVYPYISTITPTFGAVGLDVAGTGFGNYVDSGTTKLTLDGTSIALSSWTDTLIRGVAPSSLALGTHTAIVVISSNVGTVQSNAVVVNITSGMRGSSLFLESRKTVWPPLYYQASLRLRAGHGGTVTAPSRAAVTVPPTALDADTDVSLTRAEMSTLDDSARRKARAAAALGEMGEPIEFGAAGTRFREPVTIELPYDIASVPLGRESELAVYYWDRVAGIWTALPTVVDALDHRLRAQTDHFSLYQPLLSGIAPAAAAPAAFGFVDLYAFPNPARQNHVVTIRSQVGLADEVDIHIYDVSGRLVRSDVVSSSSILDDGNGKGPQYTYDYVWDTGNVGSGVYLFAITAKKAGWASIQKTGKVGVIK